MMSASFERNVEVFFCFWLAFWITAYLWCRVAYPKATFTDDYGFTDRLTRLFFGGASFFFSAHTREKAAVTKGKAREVQGLFDI